MDDIIELDFDNKEMRKAMIEAMKFWVTEADIDGFRCDLAFWVELDFWQEAKKELDTVKSLFWLAETDPLEHPEYMQVFDAAYTWTWMHKTRAFYQENLPVAALDSVLDRYEQAPGIKAWFTTNHDENSWNGTEYEKYGDMAKALAVFSATWPGMPLIYNGQELPNRKRLKFFEKDTIEWTGKNELHDFYKTLLTLHRTHPAAGAKGAPALRLGNGQWFGYHRSAGEKQLLVLLNLSRSAITIDSLDQRTAGNYRDVFSGSAVAVDNAKTFQLKPWDFIVLEK